MKNGFFLLILLVLSASGGGYWLGRHRAQPQSAVKISATPAAPVKQPALVSLPSVRVKPEAVAVTGTNLASGKMSLAEVEAKLLELKKNGGRAIYGRQNWMELTKALLDLDPADIPQLMAFIDANLPRQMRGGLRYQLIERWADADLPAAMAYANTLTDRQEREQTISIVAGAWAAKDPQAAAAWAKQLPSGQFRNQVLDSIVNAMAATDPQAALDLAQASDMGNSRRYGMGFAYQIFSQWAAKDPVAATAAAAQLTSAQERSQAFQAIASSWAQTDPTAAMTWASTLTNGNDKRNATTSILDT